ncbi:MAG TPA: hypothetical protein VG013_00935 [Gemmataceae bacterium]|jgi:hypothetical protein|nr:hypothetical protein [Gemmataceae bacterium]
MFDQLPDLPDDDGAPEDADALDDIPPVDAPPPAPWERQPGEPDKGYALFSVYRSLGPLRSIVAACKQFYPDGASSGKVRVAERWSSAWKWPQRATAWDAELDRLAMITQAEERKAMAARHAKQAVSVQEKALADLEAVDPKTLSPADRIKWFTAAVQVERTARGEPSTITEERHKGEIKVTVEDVVAAEKRVADWRRSRFGNAGNGTN